MTTSNSTFNSWFTLFSELDLLGFNLSNELEDILLQQFGDLLLPLEISELDQNNVTIKYNNTINTNTIFNLEELFPDLGINELNTIIDLIIPDSFSNLSFGFSKNIQNGVSDLSLEAVINLDNQGNSIIAEINYHSNGEIDFGFSYLNTLQFDWGTIIPTIPSSLLSVIPDTLSDLNVNFTLNNNGVIDHFFISSNINNFQLSLEINDPNQVKLTYALSELDLTDLLGVNTPSVLNGFNLNNVSLIGVNYNYQNSELHINQGIAASGLIEFNGDGDNSIDSIADFFDDFIGIQTIYASAIVDSQGFGFIGSIDTHLQLFPFFPADSNDFTLILDGLNFGIDVVNTGDVRLIIQGDLLLRNFDPFQNNEPELRLSGGLILEPESITATFEIDAQGELAWRPFGLDDFSFERIALQAGIGLNAATLGFDNFGILLEGIDIDSGSLDVNFDGAFIVDTTDPNKNGVVLTLNESVNLTEFFVTIASPVIFAVSQFDVIEEAINFLGDVIDVEVDSLTDIHDLDGDGDTTDPAPFFKFAPLGLEIAGNTINPGIGFNAQANLWGARAEFTFNTIGDYPNITGVEAELIIEEIDFTFLKITGSQDSDLNLALSVNGSPLEFSLIADARIEFFGRDLANIDLEISQEGVIIRELDIDLWVVTIDIDDFIIDINRNNLSQSSLSGSASLTAINGNFTLAQGEISLDQNGFFLNTTFSLFNLLTIDTELEIDFQNLTAFGSGTISAFNNSLSLAQGEVFISQDGFSLNIEQLGFGNFLAFQDVELNINLNSQNPSASGSGSFVLFGQTIAGGSFDISNNGVFIEDVLLNFGIASIEIPELSFNTNTNAFNAQGNLSVFGVELANANISFNGSNFLTINGSVNLDIPRIGTIAGIGVTTNIYLDNAGNFDDVGIAVDFEFAGINFSSGEVRGSSIVDIVVDEIGGFFVDLYYEAVEFFEDVAQEIVDFVNVAVTEIVNISNTVFQELENIINEIADAFVEGYNTVVDFFNGGIITGTYGDDKLGGTVVNNEISGLSGNDVIIGAGGNDVIYGEDVYNNGFGNDLIYGGNGNDHLYGNRGNDTIYGETGDDLIFGGDDHDYLVGGIGFDRIHGGNGNDIIVDTEGIVFGENGYDTLIADYRNLSYNGKGIHLRHNGENNIKERNNGTAILTFHTIETLNVTGTIYNDVLTGASGKDNLRGEAGNDLIEGEGGDDNLFGGTGNDTIRGGVGNDLIRGDDGNDFLQGDSGNDTLDGGNGNDTLYSSSGNDILKGGTGNDSLSAFNSFHSVEFYGESGQDTIIGGHGNDILDGGSDNDILNGGSGNDTLNGGSGNDTLNGSFNNDLLLGGNGDDYLYDDGFNSIGENDTLDGGNGNDTLKGGNGDDFLIGGDGNDYLYGEQGNDILNGGKGIDRLYGGNGNDYLAGNEGNDYLAGEDGNDTLNGGTGSDTLNGGNGDDILIGNSEEYTANTSQSIWYINGSSNAIFTNQLVGINDINNDGKADLILQYDQNGSRRWQTRLSNGTSFVSDGDWTSTTTPNVEVVGVEDANGDGNADLILQFDQNGSRHWQTRLSNGNAFISHGNWTSTTTPNVEVVGINDADGDGMADLILQYDHNGSRRWQTRLSEVRLLFLVVIGQVPPPLMWKL